MHSSVRRDCEAADEADPLGAVAARFAGGTPGTLYFDANSVGAMPCDVPERMARRLVEWQTLRRRGWSDADWLDAPRRLGDKLAPILGASPGRVAVCDTTSVNLHKALAAALAANPGRRKVVSQAGTFPTDLYVAQALLGPGWRDRLHLVPEGAPIEPALDGDTAVLYLSQVDYRSGVRLDLPVLTRAAHDAGAFVLWDLSHGAGAVPAGLDAADADLAVGCGYKYLCGGPGAPAWIYAHPRHADLRPAPVGWMGHAQPFAFAAEYTPAEGAGRFLAGTPAVLANTAIEAACDIWAAVDPAQVFAKHAALGDRLIALADAELARLGMTVASPRDATARGGFVALRHPAAAAVAAALGEAGVVVSYRPPDNIRFGLSALYHGHADVWDAVARTARVLRTGAWQDARFRLAKAV